MSAILLQSTEDNVTIYLETSGGSPATGLEVVDVQVDLRKSGEAFFTTKTLLDPVDALASIGSGVDGTVTVAVPGTAGNSYTVEVTVPAGTSSLTAVKAGTVLTIQLAVSAGVPIGSANTATLVAAAINDLDGEIAATASGTGADPLTGAEGPTTLVGGVDGTFTDLGSGFYNVTLSATDTDTVGTLYLRATGATIRPIVESFSVAALVATAPAASQTIPTTTIFGYLYKADGTGLSGASVAAKVLSQPTVLHPGTEGLIVDTSLITTTTDSSGFFTIDLITGAAVEVIIPAGNFRRTLVVPSVSTNLFDIP